MKPRFVGCLLFVGGLTAFASSAFAQVIEFRATINAAQEPNNASQSGATGSAALLYDMAANTFDLFLTLNDVVNPITLSHVHEAVAGVNGSIVTNLGPETVSSYRRSGNTVYGVFHGVTHGGSKLTLLRNGAYLNFHSAVYPGGEMRGQLIAQPKRLTAIITPSQEIAATPIVSGAFGAAIMSYNPGTNRVNLQITLYNFTNTLMLSHYHEAPAGVNGSVVKDLGGAAAYRVNGTYITQIFDNLDYGTADPIRLLTGGAYLNFHSNVYGSGEIRGQVRAFDEIAGMSRIINASVRGFAGQGNQTLVAGLGVIGNEPVGVRIIGRGPSLSAFGVSGALGDPTIALYNGSGVLMATNDNHALTSGSLPALLDSKDSVLDVILPPGGYSIVVSGVGGTTGVAMVESFELHNGSSVNIAGSEDKSLAKISSPVLPISSSLAAAKTAVASEICVAPMQAPAGAAR